MSPRAKNGKPIVAARPALDKASLGTLRRLAGGEKLVARRTFPHPFSYGLSWTDGAYGTAVAKLAPAHAQALIHGEYVIARHPSPLDDFIVYDLTPKGEAVAANGLPEPERSQEELFEAAS